jgi:hypothetical protein
MNVLAYGLFALYGAAILAAVLFNTFDSLVLRHASRRHAKLLEDPDAPDEAEIVIALVHGTWAKAASWTAPNSPFRSSLRSTLEKPVIFDRFPWSGSNSIGARRRASELLKQRLHALFERHPRARIFVVGHSHGGSVALDSLDPALAERLGGIVCLATPVLMARARVLDPLARVALAIVPVIPMVGLAEWIIERTGMESYEGFIVVSCVAAGLLLSMRASRWSKRLQTQNDLSFLDSDKVLFLRAAGDEASAVLTAAHLMSWAVGKISTGPTRALWNAQQRVESWRKRLVRHAPFIVAAMIGGVAGVCGATLIQINWIANPLLAVSGLAFAISALLLAILVQGGTLTWVAAFVFSAVLLIPMAVVLGLAGLTIGPEMAVAATLLEVTAEATPPGAWHIIQLKPALRDADNADTLQHSSIYQNAEAVTLVGNWIRRRAGFG